MFVWLVGGLVGCRLFVCLSVCLFVFCLFVCLLACLLAYVFDCLFCWKASTVAALEGLSGLPTLARAESCQGAVSQKEYFPNLRLPTVCGAASCSLSVPCKTDSGKQFWPQLRGIVSCIPYGVLYPNGRDSNFRNP